MFLFLSFNLQACDCIWGGSFFHSIDTTNTILIGKVVKYGGYELVERSDTSFYYPTTMIVEINEVLFKNDKSLLYKQRMKLDLALDVKVLGNVSNNCRPNISDFALGTTWLFKMSGVREFNYYQIDYSISNCSTNYLLVNEDVVFGNVFGENQKFEQDGVDIQMSIDEFKVKLNDKIKAIKVGGDRIPN